jgi:hypothetical protein
MNDWIFLASFLHTFEAHLAESLLKDAGIETMLENEYTVGVYDGISNALGGVRLLVIKKDLELAKELISAIEY